MGTSHGRVLSKRSKPIHWHEIRPPFVCNSYEAVISSPAVNMCDITPLHDWCDIRTSWLTWHQNIMADVTSEHHDSCDIKASCLVWHQNIIADMTSEHHGCCDITRSWQMQMICPNILAKVMSEYRGESNVRISWWKWCQYSMRVVIFNPIMSNSGISLHYVRIQYFIHIISDVNLHHRMSHVTLHNILVNVRLHPMSDYTTLRQMWHCQILDVPLPHIVHIDNNMGNYAWDHYLKKLHMPFHLNPIILLLLKNIYIIPYSRYRFHLLHITSLWCNWPTVFIWFQAAEKYGRTLSASFDKNTINYYDMPATKTPTPKASIAAHNDVLPSPPKTKSREANWNQLSQWRKRRQVVQAEARIVPAMTPPNLTSRRPNLKPWNLSKLNSLHYYTNWRHQCPNRQVREVFWW